MLLYGMHNAWNAIKWQLTDKFNYMPAVSHWMHTCSTQIMYCINPVNIHVFITLSFSKSTKNISQTTSVSLTDIWHLFWIVFALHVSDCALQVFQDRHFNADEVEVSKTQVLNMICLSLQGRNLYNSSQKVFLQESFSWFYFTVCIPKYYCLSMLILY